MKIKLSLANSSSDLIITIFDVEDTQSARGNVCNMELSLLRYYGSHKSEPVIKDECGKLTFTFSRKCNSSNMRKIRDIFSSYGVHWIDKTNGMRELTNGS